MKRKIAIVSVFLGVILLTLFASYSFTWFTVRENKMVSVEKLTPISPVLVDDPQVDYTYNIVKKYDIVYKRSEFPFTKSDTVNRESKVIGQK